MDTNGNSDVKGILYILGMQEVQAKNAKFNFMWWISLKPPINISAILVHTELWTNWANADDDVQFIFCSFDA